MSDFQRLYEWRKHQFEDPGDGFKLCVACGRPYGQNHLPPVPAGWRPPDFEQGALVLGTRVIPGPLDLTWDPATRTMTVDRPEDV